MKPQPTPGEVGTSRGCPEEAWLFFGGCAHVMVTVRSGRVSVSVESSKPFGIVEEAWWRSIETLCVHVRIGRAEL